ncbi:MAG: peptidoglycan DD-metalloendopeptidase family protein [Pseudomonadota bacterium]
MNWRFSIPVLALAAACAPSQREPAPVVYQGTVPSGSAQPAPAPAPAPLASEGTADARGVVLYDGYETIRARRGDTVDGMASRVGLTGAELAAYNGLSTQYRPEAGDELVLPARADRYQGTAVASASPQPAPQPSSIPSTYEPSVAAPGGAQSSSASPGAQTQGEEQGAGWSASLARAAIDASDQPAGTQAAAAPAAPSAPSPAPAPVEQAPAAAAPAPAPQPAPEPEVAEPEIAEPQETVVALNAPSADAGGRFLRPTDAPVARPYSQAPGPDRNDGVDFATTAGAPVLAAGDGTVALISKSLGGLGTIVLVRHDNQFLTVYGRLGEVNVTKGDRVARGQVIATVANLSPPKNPHLHFEVRKGAEAVDPSQYY